MPVKTIEIGIDAATLIRKLRDDRMLREPIRVALTNIGRDAETKSKRKAPRDKGRLRASITHKIDDDPMILSVQIGVIGKGSGMDYAKYMEYGTGLKHDHPNWPRKRHALKADALANWGPVKRKMVTAEHAAEAIFKRGGLMPRRYLRETLEENGERYAKIIKMAVKRALR
jgi:hypothetical protein